jgi:hypothetical protein
MESDLQARSGVRVTGNVIYLYLPHRIYVKSIGAVITYSGYHRLETN